MHTPSRRSVLRALAIGAGATPVLAPLGRAFLPTAHASSTGAPRRLILFQNPNGTPPGGPDAMFQPLDRHRDQLVIIQNTEDRLPADYHPPSSSHGLAVRMIYTGSIEVVAGRAQNASIDQYIGQKLAGVVRFPVVMPGIQVTSTCSFGADGRPIMNQPDPYAIYRQLFADALAMTGARSDAGARALLARRRSVLDAVTADLTAFRARLGRDDQARADVQLEAIRGLERRLEVGAAPAPAAATSCRKPAPPADGLEFRSTFSRDVPRVMNVMLDLAVAALACDLTRVVNVQTYGEDFHGSTCQFDPVNTGGNGWHALSHMAAGDAAYLRAKTWLAGMVATLADRLKAIPEAGGTMLDNTVIWFAQDHGDDHQWYGFPHALVGGKNLGIRVGQTLRCGEKRPNAGTEQNRLLVALLNAMGLPDETYGKEPAVATGKGPLAGLLR